MPTSRRKRIEEVRSPNRFKSVIVIEHPVVTLTLKEIDEANKAAYHGDIDGDFNWW